MQKYISISTCLMKLSFRRISLAVIWTIAVYMGVSMPQYYSTESLLDASITSEVFGGMWQMERHLITRFGNESAYDSTSQRERHNLLVGTLNATINVLQKVGLDVFIDAGTLLGWYRHDGMPIPWDIDADVGIFGDICRERFPDQRKLLELLRAKIEPSYYHVEVFDCTYPPAPGTDFTGIITDTRNGFKVDIFAYNEVDTSGDTFSWRKGREWLLRDDEEGRHFRVTPRESILPLKYGNFSGVVGNIIPNDPETRLRWDFGIVLQPWIYPFRLDMEISMSVISFLGIMYILLSSQDICFTATVVIVSTIFAGGLRLCFVALSVLLLYRGSSGMGSRYVNNAIALIVFISLVYDISPIFPQLYTHVMEILGMVGYRLNPDRYCVFHSGLFCVDY